MDDAALASLLERTALGDQTAFARLYQRTAPRLFALGWRILQERTAAGDAPASEATAGLPLLARSDAFSPSCPHASISPAGSAGTSPPASPPGPLPSCAAPPPAEPPCANWSALSKQASESGRLPSFLCTSPALHRATTLFRLSVATLACSAWYASALERSPAHSCEMAMAFRPRHRSWGAAGHASRNFL